MGHAQKFKKISSIDHTWTNVVNQWAYTAVAEGCCMNPHRYVQQTLNCSTVIQNVILSQHLIYTLQCKSLNVFSHQVVDLSGWPHIILAQGLGCDRLSHFLGAEDHLSSQLPCGSLGGISTQRTRERLWQTGRISGARIATWKHLILYISLIWARDSLYCTRPPSCILTQWTFI